MDKRISEIRKEIRNLRHCMLGWEAIMQENISLGEDCFEPASNLLQMRTQLAKQSRERVRLGDREPIAVARFVMPRRPAPKPVARPVKRHLVPGGRHW